MKKINTLGIITARKGSKRIKNKSLKLFYGKPVIYYSIKNFDKNYIYYEIIFNGPRQNFIKIMYDKNYNFDTQNKIWVLK